MEGDYSGSWQLIIKCSYPNYILTVRILLVCGAGIVSGKEIMSLHLLREMKRRGHECFCIVSSWGSDDFRSRLTEIGVPFYNLRIGFISKTLTWSAIRMTMIQAFYLPGLLIKYSFLNRKLNPDIVIHTNFHHSFLLYPVLGGRRNIYWSHEILSDKTFYKRLFQLFDKKISCFVSVSEAVAFSLRNLIGSEKVCIVKNGTTASQNFIPPKNGSKLVLAIVGQVSKHKGHEVLLEALRSVAKSTFVLDIVGQGNKEYESHLKSLITQFGLTENCNWRGFIRNPEEIYKGIDVVIVPSIFPDPYPTIVMEAGLRGIPVIASAIGGLVEMVVNDVNGFLVEAGDPESLRLAIQKIIDYPEIEVLRRNTLRFSSDNFKIESFANNFESLIVGHLRDDK